MKAKKVKFVNINGYIENHVFETRCVEYKAGDIVGLNYQDKYGKWYVIYASPVHDYYQVVVVKPYSFELKHEITELDIEDTSCPWEPFPDAKIVKATKEIQEWIYAQENK